MLKRFNEEANIKAPKIPIGEASFPAPFKGSLEFNPPVHGMWNIVHTGMLVPDSHQIYICSANCMRGVVLTAAEMNAMGRFSQVLIEEKDVLAGSIEQLTIDGVCDVLDKLSYRPKAVLVFTVCVHHFLGSDLDWIYSELSRRNPDITFVRCFMDPIMRKSALTPDQKIRKSIYDPVEPLPKDEDAIAVLGGDFPLDKDCSIKALARENSLKVYEISGARDYDEYLKTGSARLFISCYPPAKAGAQHLAGRLKRPHIYLPMTFDTEEIKKNEAVLASALGSCALDTSEEEKAREALLELREKAQDIPIAIDYTLHPKPLSAAKLLLDAGFNVIRVYLDAVSYEEEKTFFYLKKNYPELLLCPTTDPKCRMDYGKDEGILALGQKAAWMCGSRHFVNVVEGAGWYGFDGIVKLCSAAADALENEKEPEDILPRKGLGCESCF